MMGIKCIWATGQNMTISQSEKNEYSFNKISEFNVHLTKLLQQQNFLCLPIVSWLLATIGDFLLQTCYCGVETGPSSNSFACKIDVQRRHSGRDMSVWWVDIGQCYSSHFTYSLAYTITVCRRVRPLLVLPVRKSRRKLDYADSQSEPISLHLATGSIFLMARIARHS